MYWSRRLKALFVIVLLLLGYSYYVYFYRPGVEADPDRSASAYREQVLMQVNQVYVEYNGDWMRMDFAAWDVFREGIDEGRIIELKIPDRPAEGVNMRMVAEGRWEALSTYSPEEGRAYLNREMEGGDDGSYRVIELEASAADWLRRFFH